MGGSQSTEQTLDQELSSTIENHCGSVQCRNVQNASFEAGTGGVISGVKAKQRCTAKLACAFDALSDQASSGNLASKLGQGAGVVSMQDNKQTIKQKIAQKVLNDCGSAISEQKQNLLFKVGTGGKIQDIELDQGGDAQLECAAKTILKAKADGSTTTDLKQEGLMDGINALFKGLGMLPLIIGAVIIVAILFVPSLLA